MGLEKFTLGELCTIEKGAIGILKAIPGEYPLVVTGEDRKSHNEFQFDDEAVIIPLVSGTGHGHASIKRIHFQTGKFALGSILCAVIPNDKSKLNAEYLYYFLDLNRENELVARMRGMANVTLPMKEIAKIEIPLPSIDEQIAFVKMYKLLGEKSDYLLLELSHQLNLVKKLRQQLLQDAVQGKLVKQNLDDEPASVLLQKINAEKEQLVKDKKLKKEKHLPKIKFEDIPFDIPENWVWCRLGQTTSLITSGSRDWARYYSNMGAIFVRMGNLSKDHFKLRMEKLQYVNPPKYQEGNRTRLDKNDILLSITGEVGNLGLIPDHFGEAYINQHTALVRLNRLINPNYICYVFLTKFLKNQFDEPQRGLKNSFRLSDIDNLIVPLPPVSHQNLIVQKLEQLMLNCDALEASIKQSQQQNEQLLQQVLREALTKEVEPEEQLITLGCIESKGDDKYKTLLLAAEIIWQLNQKLTLGHIKLQKLIYLCNRTQKMNLPVNFLKWAMGPYDPELQKHIDKALVDNQWFNYEENASIKYQPLINAGNHRADFDKYFADDKAAINHLIQLFENAKSARIEIVATLFACWEELIMNNQLVNDNALLATFYNWSEKKKKYTTEKVIDALRWMENQGITPKTIDYL